MPNNEMLLKFITKTRNIQLMLVIDHVLKFVYEHLADIVVVFFTLFD